MKFYIIAVTLLLITAPAYAGWLDEAVRNVGESLGNRAVNEAGDSAYEGAKQGAKDVVKSKGEKKQRKVAPEESGDDRNNSVTTKKAGKKVSVDVDSGNSDGSLTENEQIYSKYDFVPGDKVLFYDDFSDTDVGEFPRKWHFKGPKAGDNNAVEVVEFQGKRCCGFF